MNRNLDPVIKAKALVVK